MGRARKKTKKNQLILSRREFNVSTARIPHVLTTITPPPFALSISQSLVKLTKDFHRLLEEWLGALVHGQLRQKAFVHIRGAPPRLREPGDE